MSTLEQPTQKTNSIKDFDDGNEKFINQVSSGLFILMCVFVLGYGTAKIFQKEF